MKILFLTTSFNGMAQRLWLELDRLNHEVRVQTGTDPQAMISAATAFRPDLVLAPYLTARIPAAIWQQYLCWVVHPGVPGDRGASSLDWAILEDKPQWGVSLIEAVEKMDAGPLWAHAGFAMRPVSKGELYRHEVVQAASRCVLSALEQLQAGKQPSAPPPGRWRRKTTQADFAFDWQEPAMQIIKKIRAADSSPGVRIRLLGKPYFAFGAHPEERLHGEPGTILAQRDQAVCLAAGEAAVWLTHLKPDQPEAIKLPAVMALGEAADHIQVDELSPFAEPDYATWQEIRFHQEGEVGYLHFDFYNGAMGTGQCRRLLEAFKEAQKKVRLLVLMGGRDVWSNGIHLNVIEQAADPAEESWQNINALNDLIKEIITATDHFIISAMQGNAGAGGVALALAADKVLARDGIVLNPHTRNIGLYGSEYWTYLLPRRIGIDKARKFTEECLPWGVALAKEIGLIDDYQGDTVADFNAFVRQQAQRIVNLPYFDKLLQAKQFQRNRDEMNKPLADYRAEELAQMRLNFFENNWHYHEKRYNFVHKIANEQASDLTDLYRSRRQIYRRRKWESIEYKEPPAG